MRNEPDIQIIVTNPHAMAALAIYGFAYRQLTIKKGEPFAVYDDNVELRDTLHRFESNALSVDAHLYGEALDELSWRLADEQIQANQK